MAVLDTVIGFVFALSLTGCFSISFAVQPFDYFQFVQQWPRGLCYGNPNCFAPGYVAYYSYFTIHGLWPSNYTNAYLACDVNAVTSFRQIQMPTYTALNKYLLIQAWPSLLKTKPNMKFWEDEYQKHGRCSENIYAPDQYFVRSYLMWGNSDLFYVLTSNGFNPGFKYNLQVMLNVIEQSHGARPVIFCKKDQVTLVEVILCFDQSGLNPLPCTRQTNCNGPDIIFL